MAKIKLDLPTRFHFSTDIPLRIGDINYNGHLGNDAVLSIVHEARIQFFRQYGWTELNIEGTGIIMADTVIVFKSEAFYGDVVTIDIAVINLETLGCDLVYKLVNKESGKEIARVKTGIVFFNYQARKPVPMPALFRSTFQPLESP